MTRTLSILLVIAVCLGETVATGDEHAGPGSQVITLDTDWRYSLETRGGAELPTVDDSNWRSIHARAAAVACSTVEKSRR